MAKLSRIMMGLLLIAIGSVFDVFVLELFGVFLTLNGMIYKKVDKKVFRPKREELPIDEEILAEMKRDMGDDFVPPRPKKKKPEEKEEKSEEDKNGGSEKGDGKEESKTDEKESNSS